jgi:hypothetical protein
MIKMNAVKTVSTLVLASALVYGCGGGGGGGSTPSPNGIYSGSLTGGDTLLNGGEKAIVYDGRLMIISMPGQIQQLFNIPMTVSGTNFTSNTAEVYAGTGISPNTELSVTGSFVQEASLSATYLANTVLNSSGNPTVYTNGGINLTFDAPTYEKGASNAMVSGNWAGDRAYLLETRLTFNTDGTITGDDDQGCSYSGSYSIPDSSVNVYRVSLENLGGCTTTKLDTFSGFAWLEGASNNTLVLMVSSDVGAVGIILTK